jgi:hypothetical protein
VKIDHTLSYWEKNPKLPCLGVKIEGGTKFWTSSEKKEKLGMLIVSSLARDNKKK